MIRTLFFLSIALLLTTTAFADDADISLKEEQAIRKAVVLAAPSVVKIQTVGGLDRVGQVLTGTGPTTGVIVSEDGYIITSSFNFASKPASILVTLDDGRRLAAEIVSTDHLKNLTLLKVDAKNLAVPTAAPTKEIQVGQWSIALGRTYDQNLPNVSVGIVSALNRVWGKAIQTDAKISPANYGGPIIDIQGRVQGVLVPLSPQSNELTSGVQWYDSGIGFAIPIADINDVLERMKSGNDLKPGKLGITFKSSGLDENSLVVNQVFVGSPAEKAGIKSGDKIIEVNGKTAYRQADVRHVLGRTYADDKVAFSVKRKDETLKMEIPLVAELVPYESGFLGILPDRGVKAENQAAGVSIRYIFKESPAEKAGLKPGDVIIGFNETKILDSKSLRDELRRLAPETEVTLKYSRDKKELEVKLQLSGVVNVIPGELRSTAIPPGNLDTTAEDALKVGRLSEQLSEYEQNFWAYVPEDYNPDFKYGLLVWIHPKGDTMESEVLKGWKAAASQRGFIIVGPKAKNVSGWTPGESEFVKDCVAWVRERYNIADDRIIAHAHDDAGQIAASIVFGQREAFQGLILSSATFRTRPPENHPDYPLHFCIVYGEKSARQGQFKQIIQGLKKLQYPTTATEIPDNKDDEYPNEIILKSLAIWIDSIDRL